RSLHSFPTRRSSDLIIPLGWIRRPNASHRKKNRKPNGRRHWNGNWNGCVWHPKPVMPNPKPVCTITKNWLRKRQRNGKTSLSYLFRLDHVWEMLSLRPIISRKHTETESCSKT